MSPVSSVPSQSFRLRHVNLVVGAFVLLAVAVLLTALLVGPRTRGWFTPVRTLTVQLPEEGSLGLRRGADVLILGTVVGTVDEIAVDDEGRMEAQVSIRGNFIRFVRDDSQAVIRKPFGIGEASVEITRGRGEPVAERGAVIAAVADKAPTDMMEDVLADLQAEAIPTLRELRAGVEEYTQLAAELRAAAREYTALAADMRDPEGDLRRTLAHASRVAESVENGEGLAGQLLNDPEFAADVRDSVSEMKAVAVDMRRTTEALPDLMLSIRQTADQMPGLVLQVQESFRQLQRLTEAAQRSWLMRGNMEDDPAAAGGGRIGPDRVGADR